MSVEAQSPNAIVSLEKAREIARKAYPQAQDHEIDFLAKAAVNALSPEDPRKHPVSKLTRRPHLGETLIVGSKERKSFDSICCDGDLCDPSVLSGFFHYAGYEWSFSEPLSAWEIAKVSREGMVGLPGELVRLATRIESVSPMLELYWRSHTHSPSSGSKARGTARLQLSTYWRATPFLLMDLAENVKRITRWLDKNCSPKRVDSRRISLLRLLRYVRDTTKNPHFADIACVLGYVVSQNDALLLRNPSLVARKAQGRRFKELPTAAMLKQAWNRAAKYNLLPR